MDLLETVRVSVHVSLKVLVDDKVIVVTGILDVRNSFEDGVVTPRENLNEVIS